MNSKVGEQAQRTDTSRTSLVAQSHARGRFIHGQVALRMQQARSMQSALYDKVGTIKVCILLTIQTGTDGMRNVLDRHGGRVGPESQVDCAKVGRDDAQQWHGGLVLFLLICC